MSWFEPGEAPWTYVSRALIPVRLIVIGLVFALPLAVAITVAVAVSDSAGAWAWAPAIAVALIASWAAFIAVRQVTAHAWAERDDDLVVKRGRLFRRVTVIPYGRMQYVEVSSGPLARAFGIARVQLHTASPGTDAHISGVPASEAARLRDRLTERGEARLAGL